MVRNAVGILMFWGLLSVFLRRNEQVQVDNYSIGKTGWVHSSEDEFKRKNVVQSRKSMLGDQVFVLQGHSTTKINWSSVKTLDQIRTRERWKRFKNVDWNIRNRQEGGQIRVETRTHRCNSGVFYEYRTWSLRTLSGKGGISHVTCYKIITHILKIQKFNYYP